jgi:hypothetical protein
MTTVNVIVPIVSVARLELRFAPQPWPFAIERRAAIDLYFNERQRATPSLWNGQVLLMHDHHLQRGVFDGAFLQTDFASFMAWRDWGFPEAGVTNCFSMGAVRSSDDGWIVGEMSRHTSVAGWIYFPSGTPDPHDVVDGTVDLAGSVTREVAEETGLGPADYVEQDGWQVVAAGRCIALMKILQAHQSAEALRRRILAHMARERMPELCDVRIVRGPPDLDAMMPPFMRAFFDRVWS